MGINLTNQSIGLFELDVCTAMCVISQIQLAARHPHNNGPSREYAEHFARLLSEAVVKVAPENAALITAGWDSSFDINREMPT